MDLGECLDGVLLKLFINHFLFGDWENVGGVKFNLSVCECEEFMMNELDALIEHEVKLDALCEHEVELDVLAEPEVELGALNEHEVEHGVDEEG